MKYIKRLLVILSAGFLFVFTYAALDVSSLSPAEFEEDGRAARFNTYSGGVHVHTVRSDGTGTVETVTEAAKKAGLDFVIFSDHDAGPDAREDAGYTNDILCLAGSEVSLPEAHVLYVPHPDSLFYPIDSLILDLYSYSRQAIIAVAHPYLQKRPLTKDTVPYSDGFELINADEIWRKASKWRLLEAFITYPFFDHSMNTMVAFPEQNWDLWLKKSEERGRGVLVLGSVDAHANLKLTREKSLYFPSYERSFNVLQTHVLTRRQLSGDYAEDARIVYSALKNGNAYISYEGLGNSDGFEFYAEADGMATLMGGTAAAGNETTLFIYAPGNVRIYLKSGGETVKTVDDNNLVFENPPSGDYYVEVYQLRRSLPFGGITEVPWIVSNMLAVK